MCLQSTIANLRANNPTWDGGNISNVAEKTRSAFPNGQARDYDCTAELPDPKDAHVHGAAVAGQADILLTMNVRDFLIDEGAREELPYEIYTPDEFFMLVWHSAPDLVERTAEIVHGYATMRNWEVSADERLIRSKAPEFTKVIAHLARE